MLNWLFFTVNFSLQIPLALIDMSGIIRKPVDIIIYGFSEFDYF